MTEDEIWAALTEVFCEVFDDDEIVIGPKTTADNLEDWDSITHVQLIVAVEERFGIHFNTGEIAALENVGQMVAFVEARLP
jgi:acyl carrier protein